MVGSIGGKPMGENEGKKTVFEVKSIGLKFSYMPSAEFREVAKYFDEGQAINDILKKKFQKNLEEGEPLSYGTLVKQAQEEYQKELVKLAKKGDSKEDNESSTKPK